MTTVAPAASTGIAGQPVPRIVSLDIFRGFTMAVMIFVNDLSSVQGLSKWTYHFPENVDAMSYVDTVFPFFLFIVGMSLPLSIEQRLRRDPSQPRLWLHILLRSFALVVLGLLLANAGGGDSARMHLDKNAWALLGMLGSLLLWAVYPRAWNPRTVLSLRVLGGLLLVVLAAIYRTTANGKVQWLDFSYPEILGLIGLTYFATCLLFVPLRRFAWAPLLLFLAAIGFNIACTAKWTTIDTHSMFVFPFNNGAMVAITLAGVTVSGVFLGRHDWGVRTKILLALCFSIACAIAGWLLVPLGISKIRATPTWSLWSVAAAAAVFALLYWVCDVRGWTRWAWLLRPAGSNTLLTYLLPDAYFYLIALMGLGWVLGRFDTGVAGIVRAVLFTVFILLASRLFTRAKIRMQL